MARIVPNNSVSSSSVTQRERAKKITAGRKTCVRLGFFFEEIFNNKKLQIGYAVIEDDIPEDQPTEVGCIHIDSLLIRDTVAWKHQLWSAGLGYTEPYDNEDHDDITKIILQCPAVECEFIERSYTTSNGEEKVSLEIGSWSKLDTDLVDNPNMQKLILSCEQSLEKIISYRIQRGDKIERSSSVSLEESNENAEFDNFIKQQTGGKSEIPF